MQPKTHINNTYEVLSHICKEYLKRRFFHSIANEHIHVQEDFNWANLLSQARIHGVRPIVLAGSDFINMPKNYKDKLVAQCKHIAFNNFNIYQEGQKLSLFLHNNQVDHEHLKGVHLAQRVFGEVGMREMSDIDILLHRKDFSILRDFLLSQGYVPEVPFPMRWMSWYMYNNCEYNFDKYEENKRSYHIEPHWFLGTRVTQSNISLSELQSYWKSDKSTMPPEILLITVCVHHGGDMCRRLKQIVDVYSIIGKYKEQFNWDKLWHITKDLKVTNLVLFCIDQTRRELELDIPHHVSELIHRRISYQLSLASNKQRARSISQDKKLRYHLDRFQFMLRVRENWITKLSIVINIFVYYVMFRLFISKGTSS